MTEIIIWILCYRVKVELFSQRTMTLLCCSSAGYMLWQFIAAMT